MLRFKLKGVVKPQTWELISTSSNINKHIESFIAKKTGWRHGDSVHPFGEI